MNSHWKIKLKKEIIIKKPNKKTMLNLNKLGKLNCLILRINKRKMKILENKWLKRIKINLSVKCNKNKDKENNRSEENFNKQIK